MSYLLDTCVVSETTKLKPAASVVTWLKAADPESLYLSVLTLGELEKGIERLADGQKKAQFRVWLAHVRRESVGRILPLDDDAATEWGKLAARAEKRGAPLPVVDTLLAATAIVHGLSVVTRNESDIGRTGVKVIDPWRV